MGLLETLGLQLIAAAPGVPAKQSGAKAPTDADFAADAKRRKLADQEARRKGEALANEKPDKPGKGPPVDPIDAKIDKLIGDPEARLKKLAEYKLPTFSETYKDDTPLIRFIADMKSGTEQADKYVKYIIQVAEYAEKVGDLKALERIKPAAGGLKKIAGRLSGGLKTTIGVLKTAQEIAVWCHELDRFATASLEMDPKDRDTVKHWVKSMQGLWNATEPFVDFMHSKIVTAALSGSEAAGMAGATMAIVGAQLFIGLKALEAGVHNVDAYFKRMDERMAQIEGMGKAARPKPTLPEPPLGWSTREEIAANFKRDEDAKLRAAIRREQAAKEFAREEADAATEQVFNDEVFPTLYIGHRQKIRDAIYRDFRKAKGKMSSDAATWWDCLVPDDTAPEIPDEDRGMPDPDEPTNLDDRDEFDIEKRKEGRISLDDAQTEVNQFLNLAKPCPAFAAVHAFELKRHLAAKKK
jgi:hypothetical protein